MNEPIISADFTVEDIRKIREYNHERRKNMTYAEYWTDVEKGASEAKKLLEDRKKEKLLTVH